MAAYEGQQKLQLELAEAGKMLADARGRIDLLKKENAGLQDQMSKNQAENTGLVTFLRREVENRDVTIQHLRGRIEEINTSALTEKKKFQDTYEAQIKELEAELDESSGQLSQMRGELECLQDFKQNRAVILADLAKTKQDIEDTKKACDEHICRLERKYYEEKLQAQKELKDKLAEMRVAACEEAVKRLDELTKHAFAENQQYEQRLRGHIDTVKDLEQKRGDAVKKAEALAEENTVLGEQVRLFASRGAQQKRAIAEARQIISEISVKNQELEAEVGSLRQSLSEVKVEPEAQAAMGQVQILQRRNEVLSVEISKAKRVIEQLRKERTQVDRFLVESLAEVREKIREEARAKYKQEKAEYEQALREATLSQQTQLEDDECPNFPKIKPVGKAGRIQLLPDSTTGANNSERSSLMSLTQLAEIEDLNGMTWEEREYVLRSLFQKLRAARQAGGRERRASAPAGDQKELSEPPRLAEIPSLIPEEYSLLPEFSGPAMPPLS